MSIPKTLCKVLCCGGFRGKGEATGAYFPRDQKELEQLGAPWLTKVLTENGALKGGVTVISVKFAENNDGGLLGELCEVNLEYSDETDAPKKLMAKFRPPDTESRITTTLFDLCEHEYDFYRLVQPIIELRVPKMVFGDFHRTSASFIMMFEFINATFLRVQQQTPRDRASLVMRKLASLHSMFWAGSGKHFGSASIHNAVSFVPFFNEGANKLIPGVGKSKYKTLYTGVVKEEAAKASKETKALLHEAFTGDSLKTSMKLFGDSSSFTTVFHGDPRIDNWFFDEKDAAGEVVSEVGLLDWQLMAKGSSACDLSWFYSTTMSAGDEEGGDGEDLVSVYYRELVSLGTVDAAEHTIEEYREELALCHLYSMAKIIIGAGGLDKNDENTVETMSILCRRCIRSMEEHGTAAAFKAFKEGGLISQKRAAASAKKVGTATAPTVAPTAATPAPSDAAEVDASV